MLKPEKIPIAALLAFVTDAALCLVLRLFGYRIPDGLLVALAAVAGAFLLAAAILLRVKKPTLGDRAKLCGVLLPLVTYWFCRRVLDLLLASARSLFAAPIAFTFAVLGIVAVVVGTLLLFASCVRPARFVKMLPVLPMALFLLWAPLGIVLSPILSPAETLHQTLPSPDGAYIASVSDWDFGAVGGHTDVYVQRRDIGQGIFRLKGVRKAVYTDRWSAFARMELLWSDASHLRIAIDGETVREVGIR